MRLLVLGAGQGNRLNPETEDAPKCVVDLGDGTTFLSRLIEIAEATDLIDEMGVITGHGAHKVEEHVEECEPRLEVKTLYNPFYEVAGPIVSLWVAHDRMTDLDFLVCNGDTLYEKRSFDRLKTDEDDVIRLCVDDSGPVSNDDMKVKIEESGRLLDVGKEIPDEEADAVSTGLLMVKGPAARKTFADAVVELMHDKKNVRYWQVWHKVLNSLVAKGVPVETVPVGKYDWFEVDTLDDLEELREHLGGSKTIPPRR